ncbi:MAG TPA: aminotransferase class I/II-fold pyridoxal phosphate-dependent enzyme [Candidatus Blautia faecipullorum]|nr:aminotransferase class I/II-fold pyridoxal phosphate-dependent enzyme [Candidatus Blautia faecipullorum]
MKYDFTTIMDRLGKDAIAVDAPHSGVSGGAFADARVKDGFSIIPMWVADMNFATVPTVPQAIARRAAHPAYGYFQPPKAYYDSIIRWHEQNYGVTGLTAECIGHENGVLGGVVSALRILCQPGDSVILQSPTYIGFTHCAEDNGWNFVLNPLIQDENGVWRIDYEDLEEKVSRLNIHAAIFCSPHNPSGRVWEPWEIEKLMDIYKKYNVYVISDEIWADLTMPGVRHTPVQMISEDARMRTIALYAPSKTFNLAGLVGSYHVIYNPYLRDRVTKAGAATHYNSMNMLSMHALMAAYSDEGLEWLEELRQVLKENFDYAVSYIQKYFKGVKTTRPEGTYMLFLDCTQWCLEHHTDIDTLQRSGVEAGVIWQDGRPFHGSCHIRMNLALPHSLVVEAFERLRKYVFV